MICPEELIALISAIAVAIAKDLTIEQIDILGAALVQLGDTLVTIAVQRGRIEECCKSKETNNSESNNCI